MTMGQKKIRNDLEQMWVTDQDRIRYAQDILEHTDKYIYGFISEEKDNVFKMIPVDERGKKLSLYKGETKPHWIDVEKRYYIRVNDFVRGKITVKHYGSNWNYIFENVERLESEDEVREVLKKNIKKLWEKDEYKVDDTQLIKIDEKTWFLPEALDRIEAGFEESYAAYMNDHATKLVNKSVVLDEQIKQKSDKLENINRQQQSQEERLKTIKSQIKEADDKYQYYKEIGIIKDQGPSVNTWEEYKYTTYEKLIDQVWGCLWKNKNLWYERAVIKTFMNSLRTSQLTLLWGRPGSGKTSLPEKAAQVLGAKCIRIQVQSNWTDNQDLLGFYNIVDKRYMSTQFMDALVEAGNNKDQLYLILLDEMNLSNIEYYFSEMLNVFTVEDPQTDPYELHLYSEIIKKRAEAEFEKAKNQGRDISELTMQLEDMFCYAPTIKIPSNVRFVGTLNTDATTKIISPKVIDRSCLIELQTMSLDKKKSEQKHLPRNILLGEGVRVNADVFKVHCSTNKINTGQIEQIEDIRQMGANISNRIELYIRQWMADDKDISIDLDEIVLTKILPAINGEYDSRLKKLVENLKDGLYKCHRSIEKLNAMEENAKTTERITYWED